MELAGLHSALAAREEPGRPPAPTVTGSCHPGTAPGDIPHYSQKKVVSLILSNCFSGTDLEAGDGLTPPGERGPSSLRGRAASGTPQRQHTARPHFGNASQLFLYLFMLLKKLKQPCFSMHEIMKMAVTVSQAWPRE